MTRAAYSKLFEEMYSSLCNYAFTIIKDYDEAEDIVQGVFVHFWNNEKKDEIQDKAKQYLVRSVKFKCIDYQRRAIVKRKHEQETLHVSERNEQNEFELDEDVALKDRLMAAIAELPEKTREVFIMSKLDGLSYKEIAEHQGISPKTVENQMGRAFRHLREKLKSHVGIVGFLFLFFSEWGDLFS